MAFRFFLHRRYQGNLAMETGAWNQGPLHPAVWVISLGRPYPKCASNNRPRPGSRSKPPNRLSKAQMPA